MSDEPFDVYSEALSCLAALETTRTRKLERLGADSAAEEGRTERLLERQRRAFERADRRAVNAAYILAETLSVLPAEYRVSSVEPPQLEPTVERPLSAIRTQIDEIAWVANERRSRAASLMSSWVSPSTPQPPPPKLPNSDAGRRSSWRRLAALFSFQSLRK